MQYETIDIKTLDKISRLNKLNKELNKENKDLQQIIDKAIHILKHIPKIHISDFDDRVEKAYKVLQGEDNDK